MQVGVAAQMRAQGTLEFTSYKMLRLAYEPLVHMPTDCRNRYLDPPKKALFACGTLLWSSG
jgi:hypothetical protein